MANQAALNDIQQVKSLDQIYGFIAKYWTLLRAKANPDTHVLERLYLKILHHEGWRRDNLPIFVDYSNSTRTDSLHHGNSIGGFPEHFTGGERLLISKWQSGQLTVEAFVYKDNLKSWELRHFFTPGARRSPFALHGRELLERWLKHEDYNIQNGVLPGAKALMALMHRKAAISTRVKAARKKSSEDYACLAYLCRMMSMPSGWRHITTKERLFLSKNPLVKEILWATWDLSSGQQNGAFFWANGEWTDHDGNPVPPVLGITDASNALVAPVSPGQTPFAVLEALKKTVADFRFVPSSGLPQLAYVKDTLGQVRIEPWMKEPSLPEWDWRRSHVDDGNFEWPNGGQVNGWDKPSFYADVNDWVQRGGHIRLATAGTAGTSIVFGVGAPPPGARPGKWTDDDLESFADNDIPNPPVPYRYRRMDHYAVEKYLDT
jgi:hypothetical protein